MNSGRFAALGLLFGISFLASSSPGVGVFTFSNSSPVMINDGDAPPTKASPYPSVISVSGLEGFSVSAVTVALKGFTHEFPSDVAVLLVGPGGQNCLLMASCGATIPYPLPVTNLVITLDDLATNSLPVRQGLSSGTFKPTNGYQALGSSLDYDFPDLPSSSNALASLAVFNNSNPNGTWKLYVVDDAFEGSGLIAAGWELRVVAGVPMHLEQAQGKVVVSWPVTAYNLKLQESTNPAAGWVNSGSYPVVSGGQCRVTNTVTAEPNFFRLSL